MLASSIEQFCSIPIGALRRGEISELTLSRENLMPAEVYCIVTILKTRDDILHSLDMSHNVLTNAAADSLAKAVITNNSLVRFSGIELRELWKVPVLFFISFEPPFVPFF